MSPLRVSASAQRALTKRTADDPKAGYKIKDLKDLHKGLHIIAVPNALVDQWRQEAERLFQQGAFEVLTYVGASTNQNREQFGKVYDALQGDRRIIIASHAVRAINCLAWHAHY